MSNPNTPGRSAGSFSVQGGPSSPAANANADVVAASIGVAPQQQHAASGVIPNPGSMPTNPIALAPVQLQRESVVIDLYEEVTGEEEIVETHLDYAGKPYEKKVLHPYRLIKVCAEAAFIDDDKTATLVDGSLTKIPYGPGLPNHYGRPGITQRSRTMAH